MSQRMLWVRVNQQLLAKSIGELAYEQVLLPEPVDKTSFVLNLKSGVMYTFRGWRTVWDFIRVDATSVIRHSGGASSTATEAAAFFKDAQAEMKMDDLVLGAFLEEMQSTLFSDLQLATKFGDLSADELSRRRGNEIQSVLNGHPKLLLNKGRLGWGANDLAHYSPESENAFQLYWLNVATSLTKTSHAAGFGPEAIAAQSFDEKICKEFSRDGYRLVPVHPWQWDRILRIQFAGEIAQGLIVPLGLAGDFYRPQISLRTLSNVSRPGLPDIKLSLSILNTSAIRGIPSRYIEAAPSISEAVAALCEADPVLIKTTVLRDLAGVCVDNPTYRELAGAPYRYKESLGAIWRESAESKLASDEVAILTGCLFHQDDSGRSLIGAYIAQSRLTPEEWLTRYFEATVVPLYHLQSKYGLGLVAHGQNVVLKLKKGVPVGVFLKDFQGDLRSTAETLPSPLPIRKHLDQLPAEHLIHDLITGHFVTVLRFVSAVLTESDGFPEERFYALLSKVIRDYLISHPLDPQVAMQIDLLKPRLPRLLVNKVRFAIGYGDSATRPLPMLGTELANPLASQTGGALG